MEIKNDFTVKTPHGRVVWMKDIENDEGSMVTHANYHYIVQLARDQDRRTLPLLPWFVKRWPHIFGRFVNMTWKDKEHYGPQTISWSKELIRITVFGITVYKK